MPLFVKNPGELKELVGKEMGISEWFQITQERIDQFANATEDQQWIHVEALVREENRGRNDDRPWISHAFFDQSSYEGRGSIRIWYSSSDCFGADRQRSRRSWIRSWSKSNLCCR